MAEKTLYIFVEGETEKAVVKDFLKPFWQKRFTKCQIWQYKGSGELKDKYIRDCEKLVEKGYAVLILLDAKNDPFDIWKYQTQDPTEAFNLLRNRLRDRISFLVSEEELGIFPVVIEIETWLLADLAARNPNMKSKYPTPETVKNPEEILKDTEDYTKGERAKSFFKVADAQRVYQDNCPHFVLLADWLAGEPTSEKPFEPTQQDVERQATVTRLNAEYAELTRKIERSLKQGENAGARLLRLERKKIEQQINELYHA